MDNLVSTELDQDLDLDQFLQQEGDVIESDSNFDPGLPYIQVDRNEFLRVLKIINSFPAKSTIFTCLYTKGDKLCMYSTNKDAVVETELIILNDNHYETKRHYFLDSSKLMTFVSAYSRFTLAFNEESEIFFANSYVTSKLESYSLDFESVKVDINERPDSKSYNFPLNPKMVKVYNQGFDCSFKISDNKLLLKPDGAEAFFTLFQIMSLHTSDFPENEKVIIRRIDIPTIKLISDYDLKISFDKERIYYQFDLGVFSVLRIPYEEAQFNYTKTFATGNHIGDLSLDIKSLRQATKLAVSISTGTVDVHTEDNKVYMSAGQTSFDIGTGTLSEEFSLSLEIFSKLVSVLDPSDMVVNMKVTEFGIELNVEDSITYSLSRTTVNSQKRKDKIQSKIENRVVRKQNLAEKGKLVDNVAEKLGDKSVADLFED